ncbi:putative porin [uncultured Hymenobacter sp.]|uniref:putative porin n=1 Tax=uncultured Hymenobacter sp. TaxID=170016 RepID=UPI0035CB6970
MPLLLVLLLSLLRPAGLRAQVVDDSTKQVYGPKTTRVLYEADLLRDSTRGALLDTSLTRWPQARFWFHDTTFQQDLGNVGTASRPLLYRPNLALGARLGRNVFDRYARDASQVPYYDSRSPYSFFRYIQTSAGEQVFELSYSRSLGKNFSVGAAYERFAGNRSLATNGGRDGLTESNNVLLFTRFQTEDERYHLLANITFFRHQVAEQGGIRPLAGIESRRRPSELFNYSSQQVYLPEAANRDERNQLHLAQTYKLLGRGLTAFHVFDLRGQTNSFRDTRIQASAPADSTSSNFLFYPRALINPTVTLDRAYFRQAENTLGVLGRTTAVEYRLYARRRDAQLISRTIADDASSANLRRTRGAPTRRFGQVFGGGTAAFRYRRIFAVETSGEVKLEDDQALGESFFGGFLGEYWLRAAVRTGPLSAEVLRTSYAPTLTQQEFVGNHYQWQNIKDKAPTFDNTTADHLTVALHQRLPGGTDHRIELSGSLVNIAGLVYYNQQAVPEQRSTNQPNQQLLIGFARHQIMLGRFGFDNQATYTHGGNVQGLRIPALVAQSRVYYQNYLFRRALFGQIGVETYFQTRYQAFDYSPSTQQFYLQDHFTIRRYAVADAFFTADIGRVSLFVKVAYLNQGFLKNGYFTTPFYTALPRRIQLGVRWRFFN